MVLNAKCLRVSCIVLAVGWIIGSIITATYLVQADTKKPIITLIMAIADFVTTASSIVGLIGAIKSIPLALLLWLLVILVTRSLELIFYVLFPWEKKWVSGTCYALGSPKIPSILFMMALMSVTAISIFVIYKYYDYLRHHDRPIEE
ncbi:uncharacterized protein LOC111074907 [Drosophila obscura]|uniref:uncharacterized protein LOC111074907 n=1 Tax=Drosophila obscura TaxID=7282 RepID=UPI001BB2A3C2|nr:uncharacterized protein LOC111074907 [Drosophila obscura]